MSIQEEEEENKASFILDNKYVRELVLKVHGLYSIKSTVDEFCSEHPELTKVSVEKKLKDCVSKQKLETEVKARYFV